MPETKYDLSAPTAEEQQDFMKEFQELLEKHSMYFEPIPHMQRKSVSDPWEFSSQVFLQKKTLVKEATPETDSVISPIQSEKE